MYLFQTIVCLKKMTAFPPGAPIEDIYNSLHFFRCLAFQLLVLIIPNELEMEMDYLLNSLIESVYCAHADSFKWNE